MHRTASVNEYSTRYSKAIDSRATTAPNAWRLQSKNNKQGSSGHLRDEELIDHPRKSDILTDAECALHKQANRVYQQRLDYGIAREQARKDLPLSTYTEAYWKVDLHNLMHFLRLRLDPHAQLEIREFAQAIYEIVKDWVPTTAKAFLDYRLESQCFSGPEIRVLQLILSSDLGFVNNHTHIETKLGASEDGLQIAYAIKKQELEADGWNVRYWDKEGNIIYSTRPRTIHDLTRDERIGFLESQDISNPKERQAFWRKLGLEL